MYTYIYINSVRIYVFALDMNALYMCVYALDKICP